MKYILGFAIILSGFGALAQESTPAGGETEQQVLVDKIHGEPIKLEDKKEKKKSSAKKKNKKIEKSEKTDQ